jgi:hypothetical protein
LAGALRDAAFGTFGRLQIVRQRRRQRTFMKYFVGVLTLLYWRFKYRDPNAKGKGNVNCLDTSEPRRAKVDVRGASRSQTITEP